MKTKLVKMTGEMAKEIFPIDINHLQERLRMSKRNRYEVGFQESLWYVHDHEDGKREFYPTRASAITIGIAVAKNDKPSSLYIKNKKGEYVEERTYGGVDPYPPKG